MQCVERVLFLSFNTHTCTLNMHGYGQLIRVLTKRMIQAVMIKAGTCKILAHTCTTHTQTHMHTHTHA